jgi:hypothetical protein
VHLSNMGQPLHVVDLAENILKYKEAFKITSNDKLATEYGMSRQKIDYLIKLAQADKETKNLIIKGEMSVYQAISYIREQTKAERQGREKPSIKQLVAERSNGLKTEIRELREQMQEESRQDETPRRRTGLVEQGKGLITEQVEEFETEPRGNGTHEGGGQEIRWLKQAKDSLTVLGNDIRSLDITETEKKDLGVLVQSIHQKLAGAIECLSLKLL